MPQEVAQDNSQRIKTIKIYTMEQQKQNVSLPDNAYRELKAGEEYKPLMPANTTPAEVTPYSVTMGVLMAIIFSAAAWKSY